MPLLDVRNLRTYFATRQGDVKAVDDVSFSLERGKTLGIVGESGCGKSVTALSIMGLLAKPPARIVGGSIAFDGVELTNLSNRELEDLRGVELAMVFQDPMTSLNPTLTIGTQITETLRRHLGVSRADARRRAVELLQEVQIPNAGARLDDYPHRYSGGMRQRVMIAIALSCNPKLLIADEPTTALDVTVQASILDLLEELREEHEMAMIVITHDMGVVAEAADEIVVMYAGQVVEQASTVELFDYPEHPYTEALLAALPKLDDVGARGARLTAIPGRPPDLLEPTAACRFAPRCPYAGRADSCALVPPELREIRREHWVRSAHPRSKRAEAAASSEPLLAVSGLEKHFPVKKGVLLERTVDRVRAVDGVDLELDEGKTLGLVGESGSGKSTAGYCVLQLLRPTAGSVRFDGKELTALRGEALRRMRREMQIVFQDPYSALNPRMTVGDIVGEPLQVHRIGNRKSRRATVRQLLDLVGFDPTFTNRYPHEFSGGQRQRIGIARSLALNPKLIVCDEPVSALDVSIQAQILNLLRDLQQDFGLAYLFVAHDLAVVRAMSDTIAVMSRGKIVEVGPAEQVYRSPQEEYTKALLAAVPVADPRRQRERKEERRRLRHVLADGA